jgi:hypothetical protein
MAGEQILLDPTSEGTGTQLDITDSTLGYFLISHDYPDPDPEVVQASSIDTEGAVPAAGKHQPRTITMVVRCVQPAGGTPSIGTIVSNLQRKVGKLFREGGTCRRVLPSADTLTFDVLKYGARIQVPADKRWVARQAADVTLTLTCAPYGRAASVTLSTHTASDTKAPLVFTETGIKGDVAALGALPIGNPGLTNKNYCIWGVQSRYYTSDTQNALVYQGEDGSAISGAAANAGASGASGAGSNKVMRLSDVGLSGASSYYPGGGAPSPLWHVGTFRVLARAQPLSGNTGITSLRINASIGGVGTGISVTNDWTAIQDPSAAVIKGVWVLVDLGIVTLPKARVSLGGPGGSWVPTITAKSTVATDDIDIDWIALVPSDEGSGVAQDNFNGFNSGNSVWVNHERVDYGTNAIGWGRPQSYEGDYLLVPPAGAEGRTARFIVIFTGDKTSLNDNPSSIIDATSLDAITATLTYTPRYLSVPAP